MTFGSADCIETHEEICHIFIGLHQEIDPLLRFNIIVIDENLTKITDYNEKSC